MQKEILHQAHRKLDLLAGVSKVGGSHGERQHVATGKVQWRDLTAVLCLVGRQQSKKVSG